MVEATHMTGRHGQRRLHAFVSSTYRDLWRHRKHVVNALRSAGFDVDEMETWTAAAQEPTTVSLDRVRESDLFVLLVAWTRGTKHGNKGITQLEYECALSEGIDVLPFLLAEGEPWYPNVDDKLADSGVALWRAEIERNHVVSYFGLQPESIKIDAALVRWILERDKQRRASTRAARTDDSLDAAIQNYLTFIGVPLYPLAFRTFRDHINYHLDFVLSQHARHLELLLKLFPDGIDAEPPLPSPSDRASALNALGRAFKNTGEPDRAVQIFRRQLQLQHSAGVPRVVALGNLANALRLVGRLKEADDTASEMLEQAATVNEPKWQAYSLYWNGVLRAGIGRFDEAVLLLRYAQLRFEDLNRDDRTAAAAGLGRICAHLAQIELWLENPAAALIYARHAEQLAHVHGEGREMIFSGRLIGTAQLRLGDAAAGRAGLQRTLARAKECEYLEEQLAVTVALAELERRSGDPRRAYQLLTDELRERAATGGYALLLSEFDLERCEILRARGDVAKAAVAARSAFEQAHCDGPPFSYDVSLRKAVRYLRELGSGAPERRPLTHALRAVPVDLIPFDERDRAQARFRAEFSKYFSAANGHYRYAPTKFAKLLAQNWHAIRAIATARTQGRGAGDLQQHDLNVPPQFIEIHLGHPCNLSCSYCRGGLREHSNKEAFLPADTALKAIDEALAMSRELFVRFSGLIGEPLRHPDVVPILARLVNKPGLSWGLTTNGVLMSDPSVRRALLAARQVHVSVDAGSDETYRRLKRGRHGDFQTVVDNIAALVRERGSTPTPEIVVSYLLQEDNVDELPGFARQIKTLGVDTIEIKMQHYDARRVMLKGDVDRAYECIGELTQYLDDHTFRTVVVQTRAEANKKLDADRSAVDFEMCYANLLGLNATIDPTGKVHMCCQYHQPTLDEIGDVGGAESFDALWHGDRRLSALRAAPRDKCQNCSPSDQFVNRFVEFLTQAHSGDSSFLDWVEQEVL
jgi:MoaA/NifB/PqqE/SkfB family radical SAM enzyme